MFFPVTGISSNDEYVRSEMQLTTLTLTRKVFFYHYSENKHVLLKVQLPGKDEYFIA